MIAIQFPAGNFRMRETQVGEEIFDIVRKRWVKLNPEEWVRQNFINYLTQITGVPASLIGVEKEIKVGELRRRFDIVIFKTDGKPWMLIECKAMEVELSEKTIAQTTAYLSGLPCNYIIITNGSFTYGWKVCDRTLEELVLLPAYNQH